MWRDSVCLSSVSGLLNRLCGNLILEQSVSVRCAVLTSNKNGETAFYCYDPALFLLIQSRVDVLRS